jgi:putative endonuclease
MDRATLGRIGEAAAAEALAARGYVILQRNVRTRWGELDLVAAQGSEIVFVEVKTRTAARCGRPLEAIDPLKQRRLVRLASAFLHARGLHLRSCRFDAVGVTLTPEGRVLEVEIVPDAFEGGRG